MKEHLTTEIDLYDAIWESSGWGIPPNHKDRASRTYREVAKQVRLNIAELAKQGIYVEAG